MDYDIVIGNSMVETKKLPHKKFKALITSPPYNVGKNYRGYSDNMPEYQYQNMLKEIFSHSRDALTDDGLMFINLSDEARNPFRTHDVMRLLVSSVGMYPVHRVVWSKPNVQPLAPEKQMGFSHEFIFVLAKSEESPYKFNYYEEVDVWEFYERKDLSFDHPAVFPVELPERCAKLICKAGDSILDPFFGIGNTMLAARRLGLNCTGIELSHSYLDDIKRNVRYGESMYGGEHFRIIERGEVVSEVFCEGNPKLDLLDDTAEKKRMTQISELSHITGYFGEK